MFISSQWDKMSINGESSTLVLLFLGVGVDNCKDAACLKNRKEHLDAAGKILFGQIKPKLCCLGGEKTHTHNGKKAQYTNIKTTSQLWSMVDRPSWFGDVLLLRDLDSLLSVIENWILKFIKTLCRRMCNWVMQHENNLNRMSNSTTELFQKKKIHLLEWLRPALTWLGCFVDREWFTLDIPRILLNWKSFV